jgi:hypothetical protein
VVCSAAWAVQMRQTRQDKEKAQGMAGLTTEGLLAAQRQAAATPAEAISAGLAQEQFGQQQTARKKADREAKQLQAEKLAKSELSRMGIRHKALVKEGKTAEAAKLLTQMGEIAKGAMIEVGDFVEDVDTADKNRYMNIGGGVVFDSKEGKFINNETGETEDADSMNENEFAQRIFQNKEAYTPESWAEYSKGITEKGVRESSKVLKPVDVVKEAAGASASKVTDASRVLGVIDDMLALAPESAAGAVGQAALSAVPWTDYQALETKTNTLRANTAFDRLQKMRDSSKTGGALGQVSEKELGLLQDNLAALNPTSKTFRQDLEVIKQAYQRIIDIEMGPDSGSPNYQTGPDGRVFYRDATSGVVYDYATGDPVPKRG